MGKIIIRIVIITGVCFLCGASALIVIAVVLVAFNFVTGATP